MLDLLQIGLSECVIIGKRDLYIFHHFTKRYNNLILAGQNRLNMSIYVYILSRTNLLGLNRQAYLYIDNCVCVCMYCICAFILAFSELSFLHDTFYICILRTRYVFPCTLAALHTRYYYFCHMYIYDNIPFAQR